MAIENTAPRSVEAQMSTMNAAQLSAAIVDLQKRGQLEKLSLNFLLLVIGKVQYFLKNEELKNVGDSLERITKDTQTLGKAIERANAAAKDKKSFTPTDEERAIMTKIDNKLGSTSSAPEPKTADQWAERLNTQSKSLGDIAKNETTTANKLRGEFDALMQALSAVMRNVKSYREASTRGYN